MIFALTSTEVERSFSKIKLIKTRLHNKIGNERIANVILLSVHLEIMNNIDPIIFLNK